MSLPEPNPKCIECNKEITNIEEYVQFPKNIYNKENTQVIRRDFISYHKECYVEKHG